MDLTALRSQTLAVCISPSGLKRTEHVEWSDALLLFKCPVLVDGEPCGLRFLRWWEWFGMRVLVTSLCSGIRRW